MAVDGVFLHFLARELDNDFKSYRLEKITFAKDLYLMQFYSNKIRKYLKFDLSARFCSVYQSDYTFLELNEAHQFSNTLKKHLEGGILNGVSQYLSDRVLLFSFIVYDFILGPVKKDVIFELMGKHANLYLVIDGVIVDCYKKSFSTEGRNLMPNAKFEYFRTNKLDAKDYQFDPLLSPKELTEKYLGISLRLAQFLVTTPKSPYNLPLNPVLNTTDNRVYFTNIFSEGNLVFYPTLSDALNNRVIEESSVKKRYQMWLTNQIKKHTNRLATLEKQHLEALDYKKYATAGNLIYQSGLDLNSKLAKLDNLILDPLKTLNQNAQDLFKKYHKFKRAIAHIDEQINKQQNTLELLSDYLLELEHTEPKDIKDFNDLLSPLGFKTQIHHKKKKAKPNIMTIKDQHASYYVGKNSLQNEYLVHSFAQKHFFWFHVKDGGGAHVVVDCQVLNETVIRTAAMLAASYSKHYNSSSVPVIYTMVKYLSKIGGKPGFYLKYKNEKTIFIDPDNKLLKELTSRQ